MTTATLSRADVTKKAEKKYIAELLKTDRALGELEKLARARIVKAHKEWPAKGHWFDIEAGKRVV